MIAECMKPRVTDYHVAPKIDIISQASDFSNSCGNNLKFSQNVYKQVKILYLLEDDST